MDPEPKKSKPFNYKRGIIILIASVAVILLVLPMFTGRTCCGHNRSSAINNAKQIGLALFAFEDEYGSYPSDETKSLVNENNPDSVYDFSGNSSNAAFRQLMKAGITESEQMFYAKIKGSVKPDGNITHGEAIKKGEVGFSYISSISSKNDPKTPIVLTPLIPGTTKFDPEPFDGQAIILHIDNSVSTYHIHKDGHVYDKHGVELLHPKNTFWNGKTPVIHYPE